jgi:hypothetical protein
MQARMNTESIINREKLLNLYGKNEWMQGAVPLEKFCFSTGEKIVRSGETHTWRGQ